MSFDNSKPKMLANMVRLTNSKQSVQSDKGRKKFTNEYADKVAKKTHFSPEETKALIQIHNRITQAYGTLGRMQFREIIHGIFNITDDVMLDRVFRTFDANNDGAVDEVEWVEGLSIVLRGTPDERIQFCYFVFDLNGDRSLSREELLHCLKGCVMPWEGIMTIDEIEESIKDIVETRNEITSFKISSNSDNLVLKKLDIDHDGVVSFSDFKKAVYRDPLLLQSVGQCIPSRSAMATFLATFTYNFRAYPEDYGGQWRLKAKNHLLWEKIKEDPSLVTGSHRSSEISEESPKFSQYLSLRSVPTPTENTTSSFKMSVTKTTSNN